MSLNARVALAGSVLLVLSPFWLPLLPWFLVWLRRDRQRARSAGLRMLSTHHAAALTSYAESVMQKAPESGWEVVARNVDGYLVRISSPRTWRTLVVLTALEFSPCLLLRPRFSRLRLLARRNFVRKHLSTTRGFFAIPALARQLVRMGYYSDAGIAHDLGFLPLRDRDRLMHQPKRVTQTSAPAVG